MCKVSKGKDERVAEKKNREIRWVSCRACQKQPLGLQTVEIMEAGSSDSGPSASPR